MVEDDRKQGGTIARLIIILLVVIICLQVISVILSFQKEEVESIQVRRPPMPAPQVEDNDTEKVVGLLHNAIVEMDEYPTVSCSVDDVRIVSANDLSDIIVVADLSSKNVLRGGVSAQLLDSAGELVYAESGEFRVNEKQTTLADIRFIVDNPPIFKQARVMIEKLEFAVEGFSPFDRITGLMSLRGA